MDRDESDSNNLKAMIAELNSKINNEGGAPNSIESNRSIKNEDLIEELKKLNERRDSLESKIKETRGDIFTIEREMKEITGFDNNLLTKGNDDYKTDAYSVYGSFNTAC